MSSLDLRRVEARIFRGLVLVGLFLLVPPNWCRAGEPLDACAAAYESVEERRANVDVVGARAALATCMTVCPEGLRDDCAAWSRELELTRGTLELRYEGPEGVAVSVEGQPVDGRVDLAAGEHFVSVLLPDQTVLRRPVIVRGAEVTRRIARVVERAPDVASDVRLSGWILVATAGALFATALGLAVDGHVRADQLEATCAPKCSAPKELEEIGAIEEEWMIGGDLRRGASG